MGIQLWELTGLPDLKYVREEFGINIKFMLHMQILAAGKINANLVGKKATNVLSNFSG
jgi:hypothetical protein